MYNPIDRPVEILPLDKSKLLKNVTLDLVVTKDGFRGTLHHIMILDKEFKTMSLTNFNKVSLVDAKKKIESDILSVLPTWLANNICKYKHKYKEEIIFIHVS